MDEQAKGEMVEKICSLVLASRNASSFSSFSGEETVSPGEMSESTSTVIVSQLTASILSVFNSSVPVSRSVAAPFNQSDPGSVVQETGESAVAESLTLGSSESNVSASPSYIFIPESMMENFTNLCTQYLRLTEPREKDESIRNTCVVVMFSMIFVVSLFGNMFVVWASVRERRTRSTVNVFIGNLAVSDLLMTILNIPMAGSRLIRPDWIFGAIFCQFNAFLQSVFIYVSTLSMTYIAIDRYQAISRPMREKLAPPQTIILIIWLMAGLFSIPFGISYKYKEFSWETKTVTLCTYEPELIGKKWIGVATFILQFAIPLVLMVVLYSQIAITMSKDPIGASAREQQQSIKSRAKKKTIIMLVLVAGVFTACWMPFNVYYLLDDFDSAPASLDVRIVVSWIAFSSVCYNPFIYCWLHKKVQIVVKSIVGKMCRSWCHCWCARNGHNHYHYPHHHHDTRGRVYYTCAGQAVYDDVDEVMDVQSRFVDKASDMCTPFCTASAPINSDIGAPATRYNNNTPHDNRSNMNSGVLVLSQLISSSADPYNHNDNHDFTTNNSGTCSGSKCEYFADEIRSLTHSTITGCSCKRCASPVINDTLPSGSSCPMASNYKSREENSLTNCCGRSGTNVSKHHLNNDTNSLASSSGNNGSSGNPFSLESSRRLLVRCKKNQCTKSSKLLDIHKNHLYCHKSKRISNISSC